MCIGTQPWLYTLQVAHLTTNALYNSHTLQLVLATDCVLCVLQLHRSIQRGMKNDIRNEYDFDNAIGRAWNRVQVRVSVTDWDSHGASVISVVV